MNNKYQFSLEHRKFVCPEYIFGQDCRHLVGRYTSHLGGSKVLVVTDPGIQKAGWVSDVINSLQQEHIHWVIYDEIMPNPRDYEVHKGVQIYQTNHCDFIVAIGGGSVIDCAKAIGIIVSNGGNILDYEGVDKIVLPIPPLICIPTTAGTSADVSQFSIILNTSSHVKIAIISKAIVPDLALIDPVPLTSMDPFLTACTGMDAMVHAFEAYVSNASSYFTDIHAYQAVKLIYHYLPLCMKEPDNIEYRGKTMLGSLQAGLAFSNASLGCVHAMAHSLGGMLDLPHGECNALLLEHIVKYNYASSKTKYNYLAELLGIDLNSDHVGLELFDHIRNFRNNIGIKGNLSERGVHSNDLAHLASNAINDPCVYTNPRKPDINDMISIFNEAL